MRSDRIRWRCLLGALLTSTLAARAQAEPPVKVEAFQIGLGTEHSYKVGTWTLVRVQLKADRSAPFQGFLDLIVPDDDGNPTVLRRVVSVDAGATEWVVTYARPGQTEAVFAAQLRDKNERPVGREVLSSSFLQNVKSLTSDQTVLATLGNPHGVQALPTLPAFAGDTSRDSVVAVSPIRIPDGMPGRWYGYDAFDAVVLDTNDMNVMAALEAGRGEPLKAWVRNGGHLVVAVGGNWQQVRDSVLEPMLPAVLSGRTQLDDLGTLESFAGSNKPITRTGSQPVTVTKLIDVDARAGKALDSSTTPLVVRGPFGFGRVTLIALDVDQKPFVGWEDRPLFWVKALDLPRRTEEASASGAAGRALYQRGVNDMATLLRNKKLEEFPGVRLVPFGWVAFFIFLYILLIGPGDYLFLKKVIKRMEMTWITFPLIVLTVSVVAYLAAYAVKGTDLRVNKVDAIDIDQQTGLMRGSTWFSVFSPQNRDYDVVAIPQQVESETVSAPQPGTETILSWFGAPESGFGGMNNSSRLGLSGSPYSYAPRDENQAPDRPESLKQVRVPIWSVKHFIGRWTGTGAQVLDTQLEPVGTDRLAGTITNRLDRPLSDAILAFGKQVYVLGSMAPGETVQVELMNDRTLAGYLGDRARNFPVEAWNLQQATFSRSDLIRVLMFREAAGGRATSLPSNPLHYLDLSGQLALDRPMFVADIDRPAATLKLGGASKPPQVEQTTLLRVILPLKKPNAESGAGGTK